MSEALISGEGTVPLRVSTAEEIRVLLARRRVSASALARRLQVSQTYVWRRLSGETAFDLDDLERIAGIFDIAVIDLLPTSARQTTRGWHPAADHPMRRDTPSTHPEDTRPPGRPRTGDVRPLTIRTMRVPRCPNGERSAA